MRQMKTFEGGETRCSSPWGYNTTIEKINFTEEDLPEEGKTREQLIKARINQSFFRNAVLAAYDNRCCITGINQIDLLIAGHISPWSSDEKNRLNPRNGLSMNSLHDKAFEAGLITITPDYIIKISPKILKLKDQYVPEYFSRYHNQSMIMPNRFLPDEVFLSYHNKERFKH
jgi:putative restriction endonuclease